MGGFRGSSAALFAGTCGLALTGTPAMAQEADTAATTVSADDNQLQDIVVTAQRRSERLQDVPVSVTALDAVALERQQVTDVVGLNKVTPGLLVKQTFNPFDMTVAIRGVTMLVPSINVDPAIGIYVDGAYNAINAGSNLGMIDMERAEVLKGPQGTLFGRNTIGGAISITTAKPKNEFAGYVEGRYGNYDAHTLTGVLNVPLAPDRLAVRLVYQRNGHDGYGRSTTTGRPVDTLEMDYFRASARIVPDEDWEVLLTGSYVNGGGAPRGTHLGFIDPASLAMAVPALSGSPMDNLSNYVGGSRRFWDTPQDFAARYRLKQYNLVGTITGDLGGATIKSITAYSDTDYFTSDDLDGTPYQVFHALAFPTTYRQFSQELQLYGDALKGRLNWIAGLYYFDGRGSQVAGSAILTPFNALFGLPPSFNAQGPSPTNNRSLSAFVQLTYEIAPALRVTGGIRRVRDKRRVTFRDHARIGAGLPGSYSYCLLPNAPGDPDPDRCVLGNSAVFNYMPWTLGIDYKPSGNAMVYAKVSKGFRSGAFDLFGPTGTLPSATITPADAAAANALALATFAPVAPEKLVSYEAGAKLDLLDHRLRINAAAYWSKYQNIQLSINLPAACATCTPPQVLRNSGTAHIWGGEIEVTALVGPVELNGALGYTHPEYVAGPNVGQPLINVSKLNWSLSGSLPIVTSTGTLTLGTTYSYRSKATFFTTSQGLSPAAQHSLEQPGFGSLDARASFRFNNPAVTIAIYGANLTNKKYIIGASNFPAPLSYTINFPGAPRTFGASLRYDF